jgi:peptidoglycan hydrolase CwlO-like protein
MNFWEKVKRDLQVGIKEGITVIKEGATVIRGKVEDLTEEGKRQYDIYTLKTKVQREIADLGGRVYDMSSTMKNPMLDKKVKAITRRIKKLETQIAKLEGKKKTVLKKAATKRIAYRK